MTDKLTQLIAFKESKGLTWTALAEQLGFDLSYLSRIANGERPVSDSFIGKFAQVFGYDVAAQVFGNGQPEAQPE